MHTSDVEVVGTDEFERWFQNLDDAGFDRRMIPAAERLWKAYREELEG
jgi:hypothetical protein